MLVGGSLFWAARINVYTADLFIILSSGQYDRDVEVSYLWMGMCYQQPIFFFSFFLSAAWITLSPILDSHGSFLEDKDYESKLLPRIGSTILPSVSCSTSYRWICFPFIHMLDPAVNKLGSSLLMAKLLSTLNHRYAIKRVRRMPT